MNVSKYKYTLINDLKSSFSFFVQNKNSFEFLPQKSISRQYQKKEKDKSNSRSEEVVALDG